MEPYQELYLNYINGAWREGKAGHTIEVDNPYTGKILGSFQAANLDDLNEAFETAAAKQPAWAASGPYAISQVIGTAAAIMQERRQELTDILVQESGSTLIKTAVEIDACIGMLQLAASYPFHMETMVSQSLIRCKVNHVIRKPVGVVTVIGPFNFPLYLAMRSVAASLAAGNGVVLKPASTTPVSGGTLLAKIFEEAGLPAGVMSVVVPHTRSIGDALYEHPIPDVISFTGSTEVGQRIGEVAGRAIKKTLLELGGNNALIVLADADIDYAARSAAFGRFLHSGQICMSANRIIVEKSIFEKFAEKFVAITKTIQVGDPAREGVLIGPLITEKEAKRVVEGVNTSILEGAKMLLEGKREGAVVYPYVLSGSNQVFSARTEMFGPVATLIPAENAEEALHIANDTNAGLSGGIYTRDREKAFELASRWKTGMVHINDQSVNDEPHIPFGGEKASGIGRFGRYISLDEVTTYQWVSDQKEPRRLPI